MINAGCPINPDGDPLLSNIKALVSIQSESISAGHTIRPLMVFIHLMETAI
jgi:hypothetical protein